MASKTSSINQAKSSNDPKKTRSRPRKTLKRTPQRNKKIGEARTARRAVTREQQIVRQEVQKIQAEKESMTKQINALIQNIDKKLNFKAMVGQTTALTLNQQAMAIFFQRLLDRYALMTPLFVSRGVGTNRIYPVDFLLFCWIATLIHVRDVGVLNGDTSDLPSFADNLSVPVPLASILQYLGHYEKGDMNLTTQFNLPASFFTQVIQFGHFDPAQVYPFTIVNEGQIVDSLVVGGTADYEARRDWTPMTITAWCQTRLFKISNAIRSVNVPTVPIHEIPQYAPGPEAYCCRGIEAATGYVYNRVFTVSKPFDAELGTIFSVGRVFAIHESYLSETITDFMSDPRYGYGSFNIENYLAAGCVFFLMQQNAYKHGPIKKVYSLYRRNRIKTYAFAEKRVEGDSVQGIFGKVWKQIQRQVPGFSDTQGANATFRQFYALYTIFITHLHHRVEMASPIANLALRISGSSAHSISAYYNEGLTSKIAVPAALDKFISSHGLIVSNGAMVVPRLRPLPNTSLFTWNDAGWENNLIAMSWKGFASSSPAAQISYPFFFDGTGVNPPPKIVTPSFTHDATYGNNYLAVNSAAFPYPIQHPQVNIDSYLAIWESTTAQQVFKELETTMVSKSSNLETKFGSLFQMCSVTGGGISQNKIEIFATNRDLFSAGSPDTVGTAAPQGNVSITYNAPTLLASSLILNGSEALEAMVLPGRIISLDLDSVFSPYVCRMTMSATNMLLEELIDLTTQAGVNNSMVDSANPPRLLISNTGHVVPLKAEDHGNEPSKWELAVAQTSQKVVPPVVGTAAGVACDFIPFLGELISPLCAAGASGIVSALMSRGNTSGQHFARPVDLDEGRAKIEAVKKGVVEMAKLVGAQGPVISKTSELLTRVAASQVNGVVTPKMLEQAKDFHNH